MGPIKVERKQSRATIRVQQMVDVTTSFLSLGWNNSLYGLKCEPVFPGLLYHWINQPIKEIHVNQQLCLKLKKKEENNPVLTRYIGYANMGKGILYLRSLVEFSSLLYSFSGNWIYWTEAVIVSGSTQASNIYY